MLKGSKNAYYMFLKKETFDILEKNRKSNYKIAGMSSYIKRHELLCLKYLRKYTMTKMIESKIPLVFADFFQGRGLNRSIGFSVYLEKKIIGTIEYKKLKLNIKF